MAEKREKKSLTRGVVKTYVGIENAVVGSYKAIETGVVKGYKAVEGAFVGAYKGVEKSAVNLGKSFMEEYDRQKNKKQE